LIMKEANRRAVRGQSRMRATAAGALTGYIE
jgi:hypothetical protein